MKYKQFFSLIFLKLEEMRIFLQVHNKNFQTVQQMNRFSKTHDTGDYYDHLAKTCRGYTK